MEVGTDESVVAISFDENSTGKTFADTKVRYTWEVMVDGKVHRIEFTNTKTSGKKRIFVDGRLLHEMTVFRSPNFQYSWPIGGHLLSIVPVKADGTDSIFDKVMDRMANSVDCQFELRINGLPFRAFRKKPARVVPVRPARPVEHGQVVAYGHPPAAPDREYLEMRAKVEELQNRPHRPQGIEASASSGRRSSPWEASQPAKPVTKTSHGDPWKGTSSSPPQRFGDEGEEIGFTTGARAQYAGFSNSAGSSSEDDEAFTSYGPATAHAPSQSQTEWPSSGFGQSAWPSTGGVQQSGGTAGAWPSWEASPTSPFDAPAPPNRPKRQAVPTYAIPWSPQQQPPAAALPKAPVSPAMVPQAPCQATSSSMPQLLPTSTTRLAKNLAQRKALLESIGLGLSRRSSATPVQVTSGRSGHFKWPEAQVEDSRPSIASTRQRSSKLLEHRKALLGSIGLAAMATGSLSRRSARSKERKGSDIIEGTVLASHETWNEAFGESAFPLVQGNVVDSEDEVGEPILSGQPNGSGQDSHSSMTWPMSTKVAESPGFSSAFEADEAAATTLGRFPPSPGFPEASPVKDMPSGSLQQQTAQGFPASPGFPEASTAKESPLPKETSTPSGMQWPGSALPTAEVTAESSTGFPPSPGFPESSAAKESTLPKETSTPSGMQWPGSALPSAEVTAESSTGFPPSPGFPESSAAKESTLPKETSTRSGMQWPGSALPSAEVTAESPAGFPPSPGFPEASTAKESPLPKETLTPSGMQWPGSALPSAEVTAESSAGFPPSPGFPESSAAKESTLPKETSTPNGMQWPGSALSSAEVTAESSTGFPPSPGFPQTSAAKETSAPSGMQWPGSAEAAAFPGGFPEWPAQESTPGGMQWPDASLTSSKAEDAFGGFPASGSQDGPKEEAASANGHSEPADQDAEVPNVAPIVERLPPKETPKEAPKFHDKDEGEVPSWWPKGA